MENQTEQSTADNSQITNHQPQVTKSSFLVILLSILLLISLSIAGFFAYQTQKLVKELTVYRLQPTQTPTPIITTEPTPDPTADWKVYDNKSFTFKYPLTWDTFELGKTLMVAPKERVDSVRPIKGGFGGGNLLTMTILYTDTQIPIPKTDEYWQVTSELTSIGGINGTKYNMVAIQNMEGTSRGDNIISIEVKRGKFYLRISLEDEVYKKEFNQILSTFKFID